MSEQYGGQGPRPVPGSQPDPRPQPDPARQPDPGPYPVPGPYRGAGPVEGHAQHQGPGPYEGPGPYQGSGPYQAPGPYRPSAGSGFGQQRDVWVPARPRQVALASWIAFLLGGLSVLLSAAVLLTSAGAEISETLTGSDDAVGMIGFAGLLSAGLYLVPAVFVRQRRSWARVMMIVVAVIGIAGGLSSLPGGILGLALHAVLLATMLQQPTRAWFAARH